MNFLVGISLILVTICMVTSNPVEGDEDLEDALARALATTVIHDSILPTDAELLLLDAIQRVHDNYLTNRLKAEALSGAFTYRAPYCAWNVVIFPAPAVLPLIDDVGAIWPGVPKSGYALVLVTSAGVGATSMYYYVFSSPQPARRCDF